MLTSIHDDVALPPFPLEGVIEHRDAARRLHNPGETANRSAKIWQDGGHTPIAQAPVLCTQVAIQSSHVVARRELLPSRRRLWVVLPTGARWGVLLLARFGGAQEGELKFQIGGDELLSFWCQG